MTREIALDTETTGLDPSSGHRIVEIGCVEMIGRIRTGNAFHVYLNPERDMPEEAERVHGLSSEFLSDKPLFKDVATDFMAFISDSNLVIHNAGFDMKFINAELQKVRFEVLPMSRTIDTVMMARQKFPGQPANLDALCRRFDIDLSARTKHGALLDAELLADVYLELHGGRQSSLVLAEEEKAEKQQETEAKSFDMPLRHYEASADEKTKHDAFLDSLKDPMWKKLESAD